jgi:urea transport system ATP-binding protein
MSIPPPKQEFILLLEEVNKSFEGFKAISDLTLYMDEGELRVIIGPNGAGKSSMLDLITGRTKPDSGKIEFSRDTDLTKLNEAKINQLGIGRKFQTPSVYTDHTVLKTIALDGKADWKAGALSHGQKQWLEIGMLLAQNPKLLLVDEPAAGMTDEETHKTGELLLSLEGKHSIIVIEHDMTFVRQIARKVTVLHQGHVLCEGTVDEVQNDERVKEVYLGRKKKN